MIVYSLPTCGQCKILKKLNWQKQKNIEFVEVIDLIELEKLGIQGVPVLELEDGTRFTQTEALKWVQEQVNNVQ